MRRDRRDRLAHAGEARGFADTEIPVYGLIFAAILSS
jgi:hypothetical protein